MTSTMSRPRTFETAGKAMIYIVLTALALGTLFPFLWALGTSFKTEENTIAIPPQWIPDPFRPQNYVEAWNMFPFTRFYFNTLLISVLGTLGALLLCSMAGYALAKYQFRGQYATATELEPPPSPPPKGSGFHMEMLTELQEIKRILSK